MPLPEQIPFPMNGFLSLEKVLPYFSGKMNHPEKLYENQPFYRLGGHRAAGAKGISRQVSGTAVGRCTSEQWWFNHGRPSASTTSAVPKPSSCS